MLLKKYYRRWKLKVKWCLIPLSQPGFRSARSAALCCYTLLGALLLPAQAPQARSVTDSVYSAGQAARGQQLYKAQCAACHGNAMEGTNGPPLVGESFLSNRSAQPLVNLVDKIQKTMPFSLPGSLSRAQSTDLAAYLLQAGKVLEKEIDLAGGRARPGLFQVLAPPFHLIVPEAMNLKHAAQVETVGLQVFGVVTSQLLLFVTAKPYGKRLCHSFGDRIFDREDICGLFIEGFGPEGTAVAVE